MYIIHGHCHLIHGESVVFVTYWTNHSSFHGDFLLGLTKKYCRFQWLYEIFFRSVGRKIIFFMEIFCPPSQRSCGRGILDYPSSVSPSVRLPHPRSSSRYWMNPAKWTVDTFLVQTSHKIFWVGAFWHGSVESLETTILFCYALYFIETLLHLTFLH